MHRSTTYVYAAHCYRPSSVICLSVCLYVTLLSHAKTAEPVEMPFGLRTRVVLRKHVLDGDPDNDNEEVPRKGNKGGYPLKVMTK